jgi:hypothetical protein
MPDDEAQVDGDARAANRAIDERIRRRAAVTRMAPTEGSYVVLDGDGHVAWSNGPD